MPGTLDLGALHRERQARQNKKRERSISPPPASRKAPKLETETISLPSGARLTSFTTTLATDQQSRKTSVAHAANEKLKTTTVKSHTAQDALTQPKRPGDIVFPHGVVKKTWAFGHERDGSDVKLEEVLEPQTLRIAVLSAFQWDMEWVMSKLKTPLNGGSTRCVFVMQAKEASLKAQMLADTQAQRAWLRLCFPPMEGQTNCMHSKLMLLFHANKLRVAIPTANLLNFDWGETGVMENSVFMIDLPRLSEGQKQNLTDFGKELLYFLDKQGVDQDIKDGMLNFDFSTTEQMGFVHSIGGISAGDHAQRSGLASLGRAVRQLDLKSEDVDIDFAASSIGSLKDAQLSLLHAAACGEDVFTHTAKTATAKATNFFNKASHNDHSIRDKVRIYFPTKETVQGSTAGAAGTICLSREWFEQMTFPRRCFRDYISTRAGLLSHNKILYVRSVSELKKKVAWAYVGSANVSESAWGKLVYSKKEKTWHVNCRNWECGVVLPVKVDAISDLSDLKVFDQVVRPPFLYPGSDYDRREPWYFKES
ncbi:hypothetical protein AMS68_000904 [Peltaster fructicola]|uniref:PLD phosphodiesterase domain-containing protein n=1 Tax=Peltaster fructicola TaxID=286661 RepID=A0A6H0XKW9_9PEZI|nr:hypothetical protein AMS68_000904 [Peltaster fructicola]